MALKTQIPGVPLTFPAAPKLPATPGRSTTTGNIVPPRFKNTPGA